jgi:hypothetical protein
MSESAERAQRGHVGRPTFAPEQADLYRRTLRALNEADVPYLVAGAMAKYAYTGIWRDTKDLDLFLKADDLNRTLDLLAEAGFATEIEFPHWLAKARRDPYFVDLIFGMGHGRLQVDESWFEEKRPFAIAGVDVFLLPPEELFVSKTFVIERYRCDIADLLHLILRTKGQLNWQRILDLLGNHRDLLLCHLLLFNYVYPGHSEYLPQGLITDLFTNVHQRWQKPEAPQRFRGTLLDPHSFVVDVEAWGYNDSRELDALVDEESGEVVP